MPTTPRMRWPFPAENQDPWYDALESFFEAADLSQYASRETENLIITGGGDVSYASGEVSWTANLEVLAPITGFNWVMVAATVAVEDGYVLWFDAVRAPSTNTTVVLQASAQLPLSDTAVLLAVRRDDTLYWRNGAAIVDGETLNPLAFTAAGGGGGETNTASNVGTGEGEVFKEKVGEDLRFRTLSQGTGITITTNADEIVIDADGGGGGGGHDLVVDTGATPAGNVYDSLASALTVANALNGIVRIQITQDLNISSGTYDFSNVVLQAAAPTKTITFSATAVTTGTPFIELVNVAISSALADPMYTLAGDATLVMRGLSLLGSDTAALIEINGFSFELYMHDYSGFSGSPASIGVINSDASGSVLYLIRTSAWAVLPDAIAVTGAGDLEIYYQRSGVDVTEYDLSTVFSTVDPSTVFTFEVTPLTITPDELTASVDDYNPPGFESASLVRLSADATWEISGFFAGNGYLVPHKTLAIIGSNSIVLKHQSIASDPSYRIITPDGADLILAAGQAALLYYDHIDAKWRAFGLGAGGEAPVGVTEIDETLLVANATPTTIHTFTAPSVEDRASIVYEVLVTMIGFGGTYATFKTLATFTRVSSTVTEREVLHVSGPLRSDVAFDLTFVITGLDIEMQVTGGAQATKWRAIGSIQTVEHTWAEA